MGFYSHDGFAAHRPLSLALADSILHLFAVHPGKGSE